MSNKYLVATYGTLKKGFYNNYLLEKAEYKGSMRTNPEFTMYSLGAFPAIRLGGNTAIYVEVYEVDEETLKTLYRLEGYSGKRGSDGNFYYTVDIDTEWGKAEIFVFAEEIDLPIIESGNWQWRG